MVPAGDADEGPYRDTAGQRAQCVLRARTDGEAPDTCRIDKRQRLEEPRRGFDVADLSGRDLGLPRFATALAETGSGDPVITDGPYVESKEWLGGFWIVEAADLDAALELARKGSAACEGRVEVRPFQPEPDA